MRRTSNASAPQARLFDVDPVPKLPVRISRASLLAGVTCLAGNLASLAAEDPLLSGNWPAWRRDGSGISDEKRLPVFWSETENVRWRTGLPGEGNSSPIVWGNRVFLTAALDEGAKRLVLCLDADNGKILWKTELLPDAKTLLYPKTGFAAPTPATDGQRVYAFFDTPGLVALDMQGKVVWNRRLGPVQSPYNMGSSPDALQGHGHPVLRSPRAELPGRLRSEPTAQQRWRTPRKSSGFGHFGTPLVIQVARPAATGGQRASRWSPTTPIPARSSGRAAG